MTPLAEDLAALIASEGPIPVDRYMALALGHPRHGYYMTATRSELPAISSPRRRSARSSAN